MREKQSPMLAVVSSPFILRLRSTPFFWQWLTARARWKMSTMARWNHFWKRVFPSTHVTPQGAMCWPRLRPSGNVPNSPFDHEENESTRILNLYNAIGRSQFERHRVLFQAVFSCIVVVWDVDHHCYAHSLTCEFFDGAKARDNK
jgi:hypothetical protein